MSSIMPSIRRNGRSPKSYSGKQSAFSNDVYLVGTESDRERDRDQRGVSGSPRKYRGKRILSDIDRTTTFHDFAGEEEDNGDTDRSQGPIAFDNTNDRSDSDRQRMDDGDARSDRYLSDRHGFPGWVTMVDSDAFRGEYDRSRRLRLGIRSNSRDYQERFIIPGEDRSNMVTLVRYKPKRCRRLRARTVMFIVLVVLLTSVCMASVVLTSLRPGTDTPTITPPTTTPPVFRYYEADGTITVDGEMTSGLANKSSEEYKTFSRDFCVALQETQTSADSAYRETYQGCLVYDIINGSIVVKFRLFYSPSREVVTVEILGDIQRISGNLGRFTVDLSSLTVEVSVQETSSDPTTASNIVLAPNITSSFSTEIIVTITAVETTAATTTALATLTAAATAETTTIALATTSAIIATAQTIMTEATTVPTISKEPPTTPTSISAAIATSTLETTEVATTAIKPTAVESTTLAVATSATVPTAAATSSKPIIDTAITTTKPTKAANTTQVHDLNSTFYSMVMSDVSLPSQTFGDDTPTETISNLSISPTVVQQEGNADDVLLTTTMDSRSDNATIMDMSTSVYRMTSPTSTKEYTVLSTVRSQQSEFTGQSYSVGEQSEVIAQTFSSPSTLSIETILHSSQFESSTVGLSEDRYGMSGTDLLPTTDGISLSSEPGLVSNPIISYIESSGNMETVSTAFLVEPSRTEATYTLVTDHLTPSSDFQSIGSNLLSHINNVSSTDDTTTALGFLSTIESSVQVSIFSDAEDIFHVTFSETNVEAIATHRHVSGTAGTIALNTSSIEPFFDQVLETSFTSNIDANYEFPSTVNPGFSSSIQEFANGIVINVTTFSSVVDSVENQTFNSVNSSFSIYIEENPVINTESGFTPLASLITSTNSQIHILLASASASAIGLTSATTIESSNSIHGSENNVIMSNDVSTYNVMSPKEINELTSPTIDPLSTNNHVSTVTWTTSLFISGSENINTGHFTSSSVYMDSSSKHDSSEDNSNIDAIDIARSRETTVTYNYESSLQTLHTTVISITPSSSSYVDGQSENV